MSDTGSPAEPETCYLTITTANFTYRSDCLTDLPPTTEPPIQLAASIWGYPFRLTADYWSIVNLRSHLNNILKIPAPVDAAYILWHRQTEDLYRKAGEWLDELEQIEPLVLRAREFIGGREDRTWSMLTGKKSRYGVGEIRCRVEVEGTWERNRELREFLASSR